MVSDGRDADDRGRGASVARSHLFAVRLWRDDTVGEAGYRGNVRDVISGAFRNFRDWTDLADFMIARVEEAAGAQADEVEGGRMGT